MNGRWQRNGNKQIFQISDKMLYWIEICMIALIGIAHADDHIDLIKEFGFPELPSGIKAVPGMCGMERNLYQLNKSPAYNIDKDAILTVQTSEIFPKGFPIDFSIVLAIRSNRTSQTLAPIFTIYSDESEEVLSLSIGPQIQFRYEQIDAGYNQHNIIDFDIGINDDKWHRIGLSIKGTSATLILDCTKQVTKRLERTLGSSIATNGLILTGVQMSSDDGFFMGDVQMMSIWNTPEAGYEVCTKYVTPCIDESFYGENTMTKSSSNSHVHSASRGHIPEASQLQSIYASIPDSESGLGSISRSSNEYKTESDEFQVFTGVSNSDSKISVAQNPTFDLGTIGESDSYIAPVQQRTDFGIAGGASNGFGTSYHSNETENDDKISRNDTATEIGNKTSDNSIGIFLTSQEGTQIVNATIESEDLDSEQLPNFNKNIKTRISKKHRKKSKKPSIEELSGEIDFSNTINLGDLVPNTYKPNNGTMYNRPIDSV